MPTTYQRALVTGGAGFIGSHLTRRLSRDGLEVVVLDDLSTGSRKSLPDGCRFVEGRIQDPQAVMQALDGVDIVFHNAARVSVRASVAQFVEDAQTNVMGTLCLLRGLPASRVKKFILASSMAVYADSNAPFPINEDFPQRPISPYGTSKLASELYALQLCTEFGIDVVVLRYFNTYGPGQAFTPYVGVVTIFITRLLAGEAPTIFGDGRQVRDFVSVHDIVQGNMGAMRAAVSGQVFNIGSGRGTSVRDVAELLVAKIAPSLSLRYAPAQAGEMRNSVADITRAHQALGYVPVGDIRADVDAIIHAIRLRLLEGG